MKTKRMNQMWNRVCLVSAFLLSGLVANAQSWDWSDCVEWFQHSGAEYLSVYAHPTCDLNGYKIIQTSPDIIVEIDAEGILTNYIARYKIVHGYNSTYGMHYFKDVIVLKDECPFPAAFSAWDEVPKFHPTIYREAELWHLYGTSEFNNISPKRTKAAVALMIEFLAKWLN